MGRSLGRSLAAALVLVTASAAASAQGVAAGKYVCKFFGRLMYDFELLDGGRYRGSDATLGSYTMSGGVIAFRGGALAGRRGRVQSGPPPRITMMDKAGRDAEVCEP